MQKLTGVSSEPVSFDGERPPKPRWLQLAEFAAIIFGLIWIIFYPLTPHSLLDYKRFVLAGAGIDFTGFYYAPWSLPFFKLLSFLPLQLSAMVANVISLAGYLYALKVFKGNRLLLFISYPFLMLTHYGQVDGIYAFGLAFMYVSLRNKNDFLASIGWLIAIIKFYVGIPLGLGLWLYFAPNWRSRFRIVLLMAIYCFSSLFLWPNWIPELLDRAASVPPEFAWSIDLWRITGPAILLLWVPVLLSRRRDFVWWAVTWALTTPYLYVWSLTFLIILPIGPIIWGVQVSYLTGFVVSTFLQVIPLVVYLHCWWQSWRTDWLSVALQRYSPFLPKLQKPAYQSDEGQP